jgi:hypothetical protein
MFKKLVLCCLFGISFNVFAQNKDTNTIALYLGFHHRTISSTHFTANKMSLGIRYNNFGFEMGGALTSDAMPSYYNYSIPHNDYYLKTYKLSQNYFALLAYYDIFSKVSLKGRLGYMFQTDSTLAISRATGWKYAYSSVTNSDLVAGAGLVFMPYKWIYISMDYDYALGISLSAGYKF